MIRVNTFLKGALVQGLIFACAALPAGATEICFRSHATVANPTITLKDVATVTGGSAETIARLERIVLAPAPAAGRTARLDFETIHSRLEATGLASVDTNFSGSTVVVVSSMQAVAPVVKKTRQKAVPNVSASQVRRAEKIMTQSVRQSLRGKSREASKWFLDVVIDPSDAPIVLASAAEGFEFGAIDPTNVNPQNVDVRSLDSQGRPIRFQIQCVVSEKPQVPVLGRSVSSGEVIREDDLTWKQVDITEGLLTKVEEIVGKEAKKGLHADDPLRADDVRTIPLVRSNDIVTGIWQKGGIRITEQFKAKSDGGKGDVIGLVQLTGREQLLGKVIDVHEALIVTADAVRTTKTAVAADDDSSAEASAPVQTVAHRTSARQKRKRNQPPALINADGVFPASGEAGGAGATATNAAAANDARAIRSEPSNVFSR